MSMPFNDDSSSYLFFFFFFTSISTYEHSDPVIQPVLHGGVGGLLAVWQVSYRTDVPLSWQYTDLLRSVCCVMQLFGKCPRSQIGLSRL